jgi:putative peptidoglycan lipid II flippase
VIASSIALVVNIAINIGLMHTLGHVGIALGTSISAWINCAILAAILQRRRYLVADARLRHRLPRMMVASALMGIALWVGMQAVVQVAGPVFGASGTEAGPNTVRVVALSILIGGGVFVFTAAAFLTGAANKADLALLKRQRR